MNSRYLLSSCKRLFSAKLQPPLVTVSTFISRSGNLHNILDAYIQQMRHI